MPGSRSTRRPSVLAIACASMALAGCSSDFGSSPTDSPGSAAGDTAALELVKEGTLTVCTHLPYKPFEYTHNGEIVGFDVDIMNAVAEDLGVTTEIVDTQFERIETGQSFDTNQCDAGAAAVTINDRRHRLMDFSHPYFDATQALLVKTDSDIKTVDDLQGKKVGAQRGTTGLDYAKENLANAGATVVEFADPALLQAAVKTGQVDAGINDSMVLFDFVAFNPDTTIATEFSTGEQYGVGVKEGNTALREEINSTLERMREDGSYTEIYNTWFPNLPAPTTTG